MKNAYLAILLLLCFSLSRAHNDVFKRAGSENIYNKFASRPPKYPPNADTIKRQPAIFDSSYYSGYLGNLEMIRCQMLNPSRIDSLLKMPLPVYHALTGEDRRNYKLSVDQSAIKKLQDVIISGKKYRVTYLSLKLTNSSDDTLKYFNMDCSWLDIYFTNNAQIEFKRQICYKNGIVIKAVPPHHTESTLIPIVIKTGTNSYGHKFRIGMSLQKLIDPSPFFNFPFVYLLWPQTQNLIWSNEVSVQ